PLIRDLGIPVYNGLRPLSFIRRLRPDLVQGWMYHGNLAALLGFRQPILWNIRHGLEDPTGEKTSTRNIIRWGAGCSRFPRRIVYSASSAAGRHADLGYRAEKAVVIPNGIDTRRFKPEPEARRRLRRELGLPESTRLIGRIGRLHPVKNHDLFVEAVSPLEQDVAFVLAGSGTETTSFGPRFHALGDCPELHRLLPGLDLLVSSSNSEAFPNVVAEAMACGVPCVATDVGASSELIGATGRVVPPKNAAAMTAACRELLQRTDLGEPARHRIESEYSLDRMVTRYEKLYEEVVN
ncbi:MAG: glycosyltransferase, partial [Verrucomicrobiota bacterium]